MLLISVTVQGELQAEFNEIFAIIRFWVLAFPLFKNIFFIRQLSASCCRQLSFIQAKFVKVQVFDLNNFSKTSI